VQKSLQTELDNSSQLLKQRLEEVEEQKREVANQKNENASLEVYRTSATKLESEKHELKLKIQSLEALVEEERTRATQASVVDVSGMYSKSF